MPDSAVQDGVQTGTSGGDPTDTSGGQGNSAPADAAPPEAPQPDIDDTIGISSKPWARAHRQLFHRINDTDSFDESFSKDPASGNGYASGARSIDDFTEDALSDLLLNGALKAAEAAALKGIPSLISKIVSAIKSGANKQWSDVEDDVSKWLAKQIEKLLFAKYLRAIPSWVPVERSITADAKNADEQKKQRDDYETNSPKEREIEGVLTDSYQAFRAIAFYQWNHWFSWSFNVKPIKGYQYLYGKGNVRTQSETDDLNSSHKTLGLGSADKLKPATDINERTDSSDTSIHSIQCLLDIGGFYMTAGEVDDKHFLNGPMYRQGWPFWPSSGDYFWAVGRWVYDCAHVTSNDRSTGLMPTAFHPLKAFACARYEGFKFPENRKYTPAVRFMFFATPFGGYLDFGYAGKDVAKTECGLKINNKDYEFIVDLPESPAPAKIAWPIGHKPIAEANTLVLRPTLLIDIKKAPYGADAERYQQKVKFATFDPVVQLLKVQDADHPTRRQVKITIPLTKLTQNENSYGCCISMGWFDATGELGDKVKQVIATCTGITYKHDFSDVRINFAGNGRWRFDAFDKVSSGASNSLNIREFELYIPDDGEITMDAFSVRMNGFGRYFERTNDDDRTLHVGGIFDNIIPAGPARDKLKQLLKNNPDALPSMVGKVSTDFLKNLTSTAQDLIVGDRQAVDWKQHVDQSDNDVASAVAREMFVKLPPLLNDQNEPIGMVAPRSPLPVVAYDPVAMDNLLPSDPAADPSTGPNGGKLDYSLEAPKLEMIGDADKLAYHIDSSATAPGFDLQVKLQVNKQPEPTDNSSN